VLVVDKINLNNLDLLVEEASTPSVPEPATFSLLAVGLLQPIDLAIRHAGAEAGDGAAVGQRADLAGIVYPCV